MPRNNKNMWKEKKLFGGGNLGGVRIKRGARLFQEKSKEPKLHKKFELILTEVFMANISYLTLFERAF